MSENFLRFIVIPISVFILTYGIRLARNYFSKPTESEGVQKPGKFNRFWAMVIKIIAFLAAGITILGAILGEMEMTIVFLVLTIIFFGLSVLVSRKFDTSYQENEEYFILKERKKEYIVYYDQIVDWQASFNEMKILDQSREDGKYIPVNTVLFTPDKLLKKMVEMTFEGKFAHTDDLNYEDPKREHEIINFLVQNNYSYLVKDYIERGY